jgi:7-cyano-7-deazaguanine synthase
LRREGQPGQFSRPGEVASGNTLAINSLMKNAPAQTPDPDLPLAVLVSGGLDSAVLLAESARRQVTVYPLYIRSGLIWETAEIDHLQMFLGDLQQESLASLTVLEMPVADLYGSHWSLTGQNVPGADTPDEAVYLPGRNVLLLSKALLWCHLHGVPGIALAPLEANPFLDATPVFFGAFSAAVNQAVAGNVRVWLPFRGLAKAEVLRRGKDLPLQWTFSCIAPRGGQPCGMCNKCGERRRAFIEAGVRDPTPYRRKDPDV